MSSLPGTGTSPQNESVNKNHIRNDFTKEQLMKVPVRISIVTDELLIDESYIQFETEMDRFITTMDFVEGFKEDPTLVSFVYFDRLVGLINSLEPFDEYLFSVGIHYIVSLPIIKERIKKFPLEPISILIKINPKEFNDSDVIFYNYEQWLNHGTSILNILINNSKNKKV